MATLLRGNDSDDVLWACLFCMAGLTRHTDSAQRQEGNQQLQEGDGGGDESEIHHRRQQAASQGRSRRGGAAALNASRRCAERALSLGMRERLRASIEAFRLRPVGGDASAAVECEMVLGAGGFVADALEAAARHRARVRVARMRLVLGSASVAAAAAAVVWSCTMSRPSSLRM